MKIIRMYKSASSKISVGVPISVMSGREKMRLNAVMTAALIKPR